MREREEYVICYWSWVPVTGACACVCLQLWRQHQGATRCRRVASTWGLPRYTWCGIDHPASLHNVSSPISFSYCCFLPVFLQFWSSVFYPVSRASQRGRGEGLKTERLFNHVPWCDYSITCPGVMKERRRRYCFTALLQRVHLFRI